MTPAFLYLHGFASSPRSKKAVFYSERLTELGQKCLIPDLNVPSFTEMTISAQLTLIRDLRKELADQFVIIGSSMGGLLAALAAGDPEITGVKGLVLLAPGFAIQSRWRELVGEEGIENWKETGYRPYYHYASDKNLNLHWGFIEDLKLHNTEDIYLDTPTLILHGTRDDTVPIEGSRQFTARNKQSRLIELNDGHELLDSLERLWYESVIFLNQLECPAVARE